MLVDETIAEEVVQQCQRWRVCSLEQAPRPALLQEAWVGMVLV